MVGLVGECYKKGPESSKEAQGPMPKHEAKLKGKVFLCRATLKHEELSEESSES